jgi:hypothetical protein
MSGPGPEELRNIRLSGRSPAIALRLFILMAAVLLLSPARADQDDWHAAALERARVHYQENRPAACRADATAPESYELQLGEESAARQALLVRFACRPLDRGQSFVFVMSDQEGTVTEQAFPTPVLATSAEVADLSGSLAGWQEQREVSNAHYDPDGRIVTATETWPGTDEIRIRIQWGYHLGLFRLIRLEVDTAPDGRQSLQRLIDRDIW